MVQLDKLDFRIAGTRDDATTHVHFLDNYGSRREWLQATYVDLSEDKSNAMWRLEVRVPGVTDADHSTAVAFRMTVVDVHVTMVSNGRTWIRATISGDDPDTFRVPQPGWLQLAGAVPCPHKACRDSRHLVIADKQWIPEPNLKLFDQVRGMRIEIITGGLP